MPACCTRPSGIHQLRPDHADLRALRLLDQAVQPVGIQDFDIVVEKQQVLAFRLPCAAVVGARPVEAVPDLDRPVGVCGDPILPMPLFCRGSTRNIVQADDFIARPPGQLADRADRRFDKTPGRDGRDDDRDERIRVGDALQLPSAIRQPRLDPRP